jgi:triosephosphate isomerase
MNMLRDEAERFVAALLPWVGDADGCDILIAPPFTALDRVGASLAGSSVGLAAQNVCAEPKGAFTGEISPGMLADLGCSHAIVGHSERRSLYAETSDEVSRKALALLAVGIRPIVCVGETLEEREAGRTTNVVAEQLAGSLAGIEASDAGQLVLAYEPVWAIGTGVTATPAQAQEVHAFIRERLGERFGGIGDEIQIQYGGSVKPENAAAIMAEPDIDGALVGGAALDPDSFAAIVRHGRQENFPS